MHGALPTFHVRGHRFATLGWQEPGKVAIAVSLEDQELLLAARPDAFERAQYAWGRRGHGMAVMGTAPHHPARSALPRSAS
jgi:hypothetical protein